MYRIQKIRECECHPYVMIYNKPSAPKILRRLQRWCNNVMFYSIYPDFWSYQRGEIPKHIYKEVIYPEEPIVRMKTECLEVLAQM